MARIGEPVSKKPKVGINDYSVSPNAHHNGLTDKKCSQDDGYNEDVDFNDNDDEMMSQVATQLMTQNVSINQGNGDGNPKTRNNNVMMHGVNDDEKMTALEGRVEILVSQRDRAVAELEEERNNFKIEKAKMAEKLEEERKEKEELERKYKIRIGSMGMELISSQDAMDKLQIESKKMPELGLSHVQMQMSQSQRLHLAKKRLSNELVCKEEKWNENDIFDMFNSDVEMRSTNVSQVSRRRTSSGSLDDTYYGNYNDVSQVPQTPQQDDTTFKKPKKRDTTSIPVYYGPKMNNWNIEGRAMDKHMEELMDQMKKMIENPNDELDDESICLSIEDSNELIRLAQELKSMPKSNSEQSQQKLSNEA